MLTLTAIERAVASARPFCLLLLAVCAASCSGAVVVDHGGADPGPPFFDESEPNDSAAEAPWFGAIAPGSHLSIAGHINDSGADFFDGFAFTAIGPCTVEFTLHALTPTADLDVCVYDPLLDVILACYDGPFDPEVGAVAFFEGARDFHLVVSAGIGGSDYLLEVDVFDAPPAGSDPTTDLDPAATPDFLDLARLAAYRSVLRDSAAE